MSLAVGGRDHADWPNVRGPAACSPLQTAAYRRGSSSEQPYRISGAHMEGEKRALPSAVPPSAPADVASLGSATWPGTQISGPSAVLAQSAPRAGTKAALNPSNTTAVLSPRVIAGEETRDAPPAGGMGRRPLVPSFHPSRSAEASDVSADLQWEIVVIGFRVLCLGTKGAIARPDVVPSYQVPVSASVTLVSSVCSR
jgi:hypothetical protein